MYEYMTESGDTSTTPLLLHAYTHTHTQAHEHAHTFHMHNNIIHIMIWQVEIKNYSTTNVIDTSRICPRVNYGDRVPRVVRDPLQRVVGRCTTVSARVASGGWRGAFCSISRRDAPIRTPIYTNPSLTPSMTCSGHCIFAYICILCM